jgi:hypothetical protein
MENIPGAVVGVVVDVVVTIPAAKDRAAAVANRMIDGK